MIVNLFQDLSKKCKLFLGRHKEKKKREQKKIFDTFSKKVYQPERERSEALSH